MGSPQISLITNPISIRIRNERRIENITLFEPFTVEYEITNLTERVITAVSTLDLSQGEVKPPFLVAGEVKSRLNLMPTDDGYVLRYTLFPQQLGYLALPKLSIKDIFLSGVVLIKDFSKKVYVTTN